MTQKEFNLIWGEAPKETLKYKKGIEVYNWHITQQIKLLEEVKKEYLKIIWFGNSKDNQLKTKKIFDSFITNLKGEIK